MIYASRGAGLTASYPWGMTLAAAAATLLFAGAAFAAKASDADIQYRKDRAACMNGTSNQDRATCLKEAGAARQEARRGALGAGADGSAGSNRTARCDKLPAQDREDCVMRMQGQGTTSGSAQQGGIIRELTRPVPSR